MTIRSYPFLDGDTQWRSGGNTANSIYSDDEVPSDDIIRSVYDHIGDDGGARALPWIVATSSAPVDDPHLTTQATIP